MFCDNLGTGETTNIHWPEFEPLRRYEKRQTVSSEIHDAECLMLSLHPGVMDNCAIKNRNSVFNSIKKYVEVPIHIFDEDEFTRLRLISAMHELKLLANGGKRSRLLIVGAYLEDEVTVCALEALAEGFDVYLLDDLIVARSLDIRYVSINRLTQAGAVQSTIRQMLFHWKLATEDASRSAALTNLILEYDQSQPHK